MLAFDQRKGLGQPGLVSGLERPFRIEWAPFVSRLGIMGLLTPYG